MNTKTETLIAIDETYRRWADVLEATPQTAYDIMTQSECPLCSLAHYLCRDCPIVKAYNVFRRRRRIQVSSYSQPCGGLRVFRAAFDGVERRVYATGYTNKTTTAIKRMLRLLDCLWERVRND